MKTGVFKKAGYFAAAFALAASGSIFVPTSVFAADWTDGFDCESKESGVVTVGEKKYNSLAEAVACSHQAGETSIVAEVTADHSSGGFKTAVGETLTVNLGGHTVTILDPTVGSRGTETNAMQLLKNSTVTFNDGVIIIGADALLGIQNYSNLTLNNVTVDGASQNNHGIYTLSNNYGNVYITGDTDIIAADNGVAFDVWDNMSSAYAGGAHVVVDTTGTIKGTIEVGQSKPRSDDGLSTLEIRNGHFTGKIVSSSNTNAANILKDAITISGGVFAVTPDESLLTNDYVTVELDNGDVAVVNESTTETHIRYYLVGENDLSESELTGIREALINNGDGVAAYYGVYAELLNTRTGNPIGVVDELNDFASFTLGIPSEMQSAADGYQRNFYVIRYHNDSAEIVNSTLSNDGTYLTVESDRFSVYTIAYTDVEIATTETVTSEEATLTSATASTISTTSAANPNTLDNEMSYIVIAGVAAVTMVGAIIYLIKREA